MRRLFVMLTLAALLGGTAVAGAEIAQKGNLRVSVNGKLAPKKLPRVGTAPIAVSVGGRISTTDATLPPQLKTLRIELNRNGHLDFNGLPTCRYSKIQPGSSSRALRQCRSALVGKGSFGANITLAGQVPYPTQGKLLVFNGTIGCSNASGRLWPSRSRTQGGRQGERTPVRDPRAADRGRRDAPCHRRPVLYGHIYSPKPFATSFVIVFKVQRLHKGAYGTALNAPLPAAMDAWGRLTGLQMTLSRKFRVKGRRHSFISSGCPAPRGFPGAVFPLARTSFAFAGGRKLTSTLSGNCKVRG